MRISYEANQVADTALFHQPQSIPLSSKDQTLRCNVKGRYSAHKNTVTRTVRQKKVKNEAESADLVVCPFF